MSSLIKSRSARATVPRVIIKKPRTIIVFLPNLSNREPIIGENISPEYSVADIINAA